ncbi:MAG: haloacid dehalogenase-like hydrolase [Proteobacteria bacterium]|nr:haloacid dehalogenase-like hydrolase [Pseudomonadota bacterium]
MRIGIDFDNTIVCYDRVFHLVASEQDVIPADLPITKERVRDHLRAVGQEPVWTAMQGYVYGQRMADVDPFPGVLDFLRACCAQGIEVFIVSHKTRTPYLGPPYDLHAAALGWMEQRGLFDPAGINLPRERVFLEPTKKDKLARIGALGCTHFIDDLPEFLAEEEFPKGVKRLLFAPVEPKSVDPALTRCASWAEISQMLLGGA